MRRGAVLLLSVLILSAILLSFTLIASSALLQERHVVSSLEQKKSAKEAAAGCLEHAFQSLARDASYAGNETLAVASSSCFIMPVTFSNNAWILQATSTAGRQGVRLQATMSSRVPPVVSTWTEIAP